jgi:hypothetical protein
MAGFGPQRAIRVALSQLMKRVLQSAAPMGQGGPSDLFEALP